MAKAADPVPARRLTPPSAVTWMLPVVLSRVAPSAGLNPSCAEAPTDDPPCSVTSFASTTVGPVALPTATALVPPTELMKTLPLAPARVAMPKEPAVVAMDVIIAAAEVPVVFIPDEPEKPVTPSHPATRLIEPPLELAVLRMLALTR